MQIEFPNAQLLHLATKMRAAIRASRHDCAQPAFFVPLDPAWDVSINRCLF